MVGDGAVVELHGVGPVLASILLYAGMQGTMGQGMLLYSNENRGKYPADFETLKKYVMEQAVAPDVFDAAPVWRWMWNTFIITFLAVVAVLLSSSFDQQFNPGNLPELLCGFAVSSCNFGTEQRPSLQSTDQLSELL